MEEGMIGPEPIDFLVEDFSQTCNQTICENIQTEFITHAPNLEIIQTQSCTTTRLLAMGAQKLRILPIEIEKYHCEQCDKSFLSTTEFDAHNLKRHTQKSFVCETCLSSFRRVDNLRRHIHAVHESRSTYTCPVCNVDCQRQDRLLRHVKRRHGKGQQRLYCKDCSLAFNSVIEYEKHETSHFIDERYTCPHCESTFKREDHMNRHIKAQHLNKSVRCPICKLYLKRQDHCTRHLREMHNMEYICNKLVKCSDINLDVKPRKRVRTVRNL